MNLRKKMYLIEISDAVCHQDERDTDRRKISTPKTKGSFLRLVILEHGVGLPVGVVLGQQIHVCLHGVLLGHA